MNEEQYKLFCDWLLAKLKEKNRVSFNEVINSGSEHFMLTTDVIKDYLGKLLMDKSGQIKLNMDEGRGMKFVEYRKDFHYTGDKREHDDFKGTEDK